MDTPKNPLRLCVNECCRFGSQLQIGGFESKKHHVCPFDFAE